MPGQTIHGPRVSARTAVILILITAAFIAGFLFGASNKTVTPTQPAAVSYGPAVTGTGSAPPSAVQLPVDFKQFWDLWRELKEQYYKQPVEDKTLFYGAMAGMAAALGDSYTVFLEPEIAGEFSRSLQGKFEGIGAEIGIKNDQLQVIAPLPGTPAEKAGLRAGDLILSIDGQDTYGMSVDKAVMLIRGKKGTVVTLKIGRIKIEKRADGKEKKELTTLDAPITRDVIVVKSVNVKYQDGIALAEISHFNQDTNDLFYKAVGEILKRDVSGVILDLRNNPGGYLDGATYVASEWLGDKVIVQEKRQDKIIDKFRGTSRSRLKGVRTVVLVNEGSASASEIVAGALQDYGVAKVVGKTTFGKGTVQNYEEFADKSAYKISVAEWLTPNGRSINETGIEPDIIIEKAPEDYDANRDPQLDKAVELLTGKPSTAKTVSTSTN